MFHWCVPHLMVTPRLPLCVKIVKFQLDEMFQECTKMEHLLYEVYHTVLCFIKNYLMQVGSGQKLGQTEASVVCSVLYDLI